MSTTNTSTVATSATDPAQMAAPAAPPVKSSYEGSKLHAFNAPSRERLDESKLTKEQLKKKLDKEKLNKMIEYDAHNDVAPELALHYDEDTNPDEGAPLGKEAVVVDSKIIRENILNDPTLTNTGKMRLNRAVEIIEDMASQGMSMVRDQNKNYWIESLENGERFYSKAAIQEVKLLVDKYSKKVEPVATTPAPATTPTPAPAEVPAEATVPATAPIVVVPKGPRVPTKDELDRKRVAEEAAKVKVAVAAKQKSNTLLKNHSQKTDTYGIFELTDTEENRAISMLADLGGSAIAMIPTPVTKIVGAVTSLGSTAYDAFLDYNDPTVSKGQMAANLGMGVASTGASMVTGPLAKFAAITKNTKKFGYLLKYAHNVAVLNGMSDVVAGLKDMSNKVMRGENLGAEDLGTFVKIAHLGISGTSTRIAKKKLVAKADTKINTPVAESKTYTKQKARTDKNSAYLDGRTAKTEADAKTALSKTKTDAEIDADKVARIKSTDAATANNLKKLKDKAAANKVRLQQEADAVKNDPTSTRGKKAQATKKLRQKTGEIDARTSTVEAKLNKLNADKATVAETRAAAAKKIRVDIEAKKEANLKSVAPRKAVVDAEKVKNETAEKDRVTRKKETSTEAALTKTEKDQASFTSERAARRNRRQYEEDNGMTQSSKYGSKEYELEKLGKEKKTLEAKIKSDPTNGKIKKELVAKDKEITKLNSGKGPGKIKRAGKWVWNKAQEGVDKAVTNRFGRNNASGLRAQYVYENSQSADTPGSEAEIDAQLEKAGVAKESLKKQTIKQKAKMLYNIRNNIKSNDPVLKRRLGGLLEARTQLVPKASTGLAFSTYYIDDMLAKDKAAKKKAADRLIDTKPNSTRGDNNKDTKDLSKDANIRKFNEDKKLVDGFKGKKVKTTFDDVLNVLSHAQVRPSDLIPGAKSKMFINTQMPTPLRAKFLNPRGEENLPGYQQALNDMNIPAKVDSSDYMVIQAASNNPSEKLKAINELASKNAEHRKEQDEQKQRVDNANVESAITADNANIGAENEALYQIADARNRADAARYEDRAKRTGRLLNGIVAASSTLAKIQQRKALSERYTGLAKLNNVWVTEYKDKYDKLTEKEDDVKASMLSEFITKYNENPLEIGTKAAELKAQVLSLT